MSREVSPAVETREPIRIALPSKGSLCDGAIELLKTAGYKVRRAGDRQYEASVAGHPRLHVVFMRPSDIVTQVCEGRCTLGVTGLDLYAERAGDDDRALVVKPDLGYGGCRLVVAVPESWVDVNHVADLVELTSDFKAAGRTFRISTKYPHVTRSYLRRWGIYYYQLIDSDGALELQPLLGIADAIVDLTSSGATLKDNRLKEVEGGNVLESNACLVGHVAALRRLVDEGDEGELAVLLDALDGVLGVESLLHIEVVGGASDSGSTSADAAAAVASHLRAQAARQVVRGEVWDDRGAPGWRVTALLASNRLAACRRRLCALGAARVVGVPARFVFDREAKSTLDDLVSRLRL